MTLNGGGHALRMSDIHQTARSFRKDHHQVVIHDTYGRPSYHGTGELLLGTRCAIF